jgi:hypothetical protein
MLRKGWDETCGRRDRERKDERGRKVDRLEKGN